MCFLYSTPLGTFIFKCARYIIIVCSRFFLLSKKMNNIFHILATVVYIRTETLKILNYNAFIRI